MPPIYMLNPPPNPFWDFVAGLEDHPFFRGPPPATRNEEAGPTPPVQPTPFPGAAQSQSQPGMSEKAQGKQPFVEDPPEVDPSTVKPEPNKGEETNRERAFPFRGRGRFAGAFKEDDDEDNKPRRCGRGREDREARRCRPGGRHGPGAGPGGPPPFMMGHPFFARPPWAHPGFQGPPGAHGPPHEDHHRPGPPHGHPRHHEHHRRGPPTDIRDRDRRFGHGPPPHRRGGSPPHDRDRPPFDLSEFLNKLGSKLGIDLTNAAEGLGLVSDRFTAGRTTSEINFEPRADIFENTSAYTIHLSLPGAKKEDVGVEYEGEHSVLRITGVVHRPEVDEQMMNELVVDGRKRETGVFEKAIRLGTKRDPANIDVAGISAKMTDGVLVVRIPKIPQSELRRGVEITTESNPETYPFTGHEQQQPDYENDYSEKPILFDADEQASEVGETHKRGEISLIDTQDNEDSVKPSLSDEKKSKAREAEDEKKAEQKTEEEQLPVYTAQPQADEDDWERFSEDSGEGEYIKIDVK